MKGKRQLSLLITVMIGIGLGIVLLPRLVRRIDSFFDPAWEKGAAHESSYREMTNAFRIAAEVLPSHPTRRLYDERKAELLAAGYLETRELPLPQVFSSGRAANQFVSRFSARFPGVEFVVRGRGDAEKPVLTVTARKSDFGLFGSIEQFVRQYEEK